MQATTQPAPPAPAAPQPTTITTVGTNGATQSIAIPKTSSEIAALLRTRQELSNQIINVTERRQELVNQIRSAPDGVARTGLEDRVRIIDQRIIQLESDLALTGRQLAGAPPDIVRNAQQQENAFGNSNNNGDWEEGMFFGSFFTILAISAYMLIRRWRRRKNPKARNTDLPSDSAQRLERLEQGMDAIAIEIERVSEGQRFVTKLLAESRDPAGIGANIRTPELEGKQ